MSNYDNYSASSRVGAADIDVGLRAYMLKVYNYMAAGIALSGITALLTASSPAMMNLIFGSPLGYVVMFAPLIMIFMFGKVMRSASPAGTQLFFWLFAGLMGMSLSSIFFVYEIPSIIRIFFITTIMFSSLSAWGYLTKRDLGPMGMFLFMGLIGLIVAMVINIFVGSGAMEFAISAIGILIFSGLTAFNTQRIKQDYYLVAHSGELETKAAVSGALTLYLSFLNLFLFMLSMFGGGD